uniref:alpha-tectorin-like n=1 Tax=Doryrhamphus excisus TaxID=161450 RepID=UPI0025ADED05|nr:alpha-tectorin-like [Doryrhamphus excisus]
MDLVLLVVMMGVSLLPGNQKIIINKVNGEQVGRWLVNPNDVAFHDLSRCRHSSKHTTSVIDDSCPPNYVCTVTGSTIIDYSGNSTSVEDRCAYTLYTNSSVQVVGIFKERRRKDVIFLNSVIVKVLDSETVIQLGPGVKVLVNNTVMNITSVSEGHEGLDLYQDQTGVTVNIYLSDYNLTVFFNGDTAQIVQTQQEMMTDSPESLCVDSNVTLSVIKSADYSSEGCEMQYSEPDDESINCTTVTEHCQALNGPDFSDCHSIVDPAPYIAACNSTLCHYPDVDGLRCEFLDAYSHACGLKQDSMLDDWRMEHHHNAVLGYDNKGMLRYDGSDIVYVSAPRQAFCNDTQCVDHEFCAEGINDQIMCFCRAIFASDYRSNNTLGDTEVCMDNTASVTLVGCLLEEKGFRYTDLHLNNDSCRGHRDMDHMVTFNFSDSNLCGTVVTANDSVVLYKNAVTGINTSEIVANFDEFHVNFSCYYYQPELQSMTFRIKDNAVIQQVVSESWNYTLKMTAYKDAQHRQPIMSDKDVQLNERIWVELMTYGLDDNLVSLVTNSCWATNGSSPNEGLRYDLVYDGCPSTMEPSVKVMKNGVGVSTSFSFNMFHFTGGSYEVYLHCKVQLCPNQSQDCKPSCAGPKRRRRRRSAGSEYVDESSSLISVSWTN